MFADAAVSYMTRPKDLVTLEWGRLKLFRYPTWGIGIYLGRGAGVVGLGKEGGS